MEGDKAAAGRDAAGCALLTEVVSVSHHCCIRSLVIWDALMVPPPVDVHACGLEGQTSAQCNCWGTASTGARYKRGQGLQVEILGPVIC